jgi:hypothetical protein
MGNSFEEMPLNSTMQASASPMLREQPSFDTEKQEHISTNSPTGDFDPCAVAKPCSPFYLYKHASPRPSTEQAHLKVPCSAIHVSVHDIEAGNLTPSTTQEKRKNTGECFPVQTNGGRRNAGGLHLVRNLHDQIFRSWSIIDSIVAHS